MLYLDKLSFRYMELVYLALIGIEASALGINCVMADAPAGQVALGVVWPRFVSGALPQVAFLLIDCIH